MICSTVNRPLGYFWILVTMNNTVLIILIGILLYNVCISIYLGVELLESQGGYVRVESQQFNRKGFVKRLCHALALTS